MMKWSVCIFLALFYYGDSAKILGIFPIPTKSHHILGSALLKELASRGHEVTMISAFPLKDPPKNFEDVHLEGLMELKEQSMKEFMQPNCTMFSKLTSMVKTIAVLNRGVMESNNLQAFLKSGRKYDLVIQNWGFFNEALLGIGHTVNATTIGFSVIGSTSMSNYLSGNPAPYSYVPNFFGEFTDNMTFLQRVMNTIFNILYDLVYFVCLPHQENLLREFFPNAPSVYELIEDVDITLLNSHFSTETPRPYLPNVIQIGGFHLQEKQTLPADIGKFLNESRNGVVYFSMGSNIKSSQFSEETKEEFLEAFENIKYDVLWVYDGALQDVPRNVMLTKWAPQRAVLEHSNVKAFITHGGLGSTVEAIYFGKPMICLPLYADQPKNAADSVANGYAIDLTKDGIKKDNVIKAIQEITGNPEYKRMIELKSDIYKNQEVNPMEKAIFWVEHVLKHKGAKHLKSKASQLPLYQYYLLDVISFVAVVVLSFVTLLYYIFKMLFRYCLGKPKKIKMN